MAYVMSSIGLILVAGGGWWVFNVMTTANRLGGGLETFGSMMASLPGFSTIGTGLLFMAIGAGLFRLAQIHDEAKAISDQIDKLIDRTPGT